MLVFPPDSTLWPTHALAAADAEAMASGGVSGLELMRRAGQAVAEVVKDRWTPRPIVVLCGPGNNGGDGFVVAKALAEAGWPVTTVEHVPRSQLKGDAAAAAADWTGPAAPWSKDALLGAELVVDAVFGAGLKRPLEAQVRDVLLAVRVPLIAIDLPSGLNGDTGRLLGAAPRAAITVTFHRKKLAHVLEPGKAFCGEVIVKDIGLPAKSRLAGMWVENRADNWRERFPWPDIAAHKGERGRLVVVSGPVHATGAARLAAMAGLRIGAGLVTLASPTDALIVNASHLTAVMLQPFENEEELAPLVERVDAVVIGPAAGVTEETRLNVLACGQTGAAMVVDADALTIFKDDPGELFSALDRDDVLTPHPGEFERLFPGLLTSSPTRLAAALEAAAAAGCVVVLKGADTIIASPDGRAAINTNGAPWLATAGSGDVLAGFIGGLIAQGMNSFDAASAGVWIHAEAGCAFGPGLIAEDLPELAPQVLGRLWRN
jgi:hydroxyethylthiazole kinase-like uncharacterized protein yjeF